MTKTVPGYEGYRASEAGEIFSDRGRPNRKLRAHPIAYGYLALKAKRAGAGYVTAYVHRMVALAFLPPPLPGQTQVRHLDGNLLNNAAENLAWGSSQENSDDTVRLGKSAAGAKNGTAKLNALAVLSIRALGKPGAIPYEQLQKQFGVSRMTIWRVVNRRLWSHI